MEWKVLGKEQFGLWQKWYFNSHEIKHTTKLLEPWAIILMTGISLWLIMMCRCWAYSCFSDMISWSIIIFLVTAFNIICSLFYDNLVIGTPDTSGYSKIKSAIKSGEICYCDLDGGVDEEFFELLGVSDAEEFENRYDFFVEVTVYHVPKKCLNKGGRICCIDYRYLWGREDTYDFLFLHY